MVLRGFPNVITYGQQYNFEENPTVILYTDINNHVVTPKIKHKRTLSSKNLEFNTVLNGLRVLHCCGY